MIIKPVQCEFYITKVENHLEIKDLILNAIESMGIHSVIEKEQKICNTDWHLNTGNPKPYWNIVFPIFANHLGEISRHLGFKRSEIVNYWFQQYELGNFHDWHAHGKVMFSSVYFVDMINKEVATTFKLHDQEFQVDASEGDILTFPSTFIHKSKPNPTNHTKTIISFNSNLWVY